MEPATFQHWPFEIVKGSPAVGALIKELAGFRAKRSSSGHTRYEGAKDDLTMALALAWWWQNVFIPVNPWRRTLDVKVSLC